MKYQDFENKLSDMFADASEPVDVALLLEGIHGTPRQKKSVSWRWGLLFAVLALIGTLGLNYVIEHNHQPASPISESNMLVAPQEKEKASEVDTKTPAVTAAELDEKSTAVSSTTNSSVVVTSAKGNSSRNTSTNASSTLISQTDNTGTISNSIANTRADESALVSSTYSSSTQIVTTSKNEAEKATTSSETALGSSRMMENLTSLSRSSVEVAALGGRQMPQKGVVECPSFKKSLEWHLDLIPEIGVIAPLKSLTARTTQDQEVFDMRSQSETPLEGLQAALYARVRVGAAPYYLKVGASYTRVSERMKLDINYIERDTTIGIISITESQNGDTLTIVQGEIITETEYSRKSTDHYYLHMIDIPLALGYSRPLGGGWRLGGEVGAQFNIGLSTKGKLLETADTYTQLPASGRFAPSLGLSFFGGLTLEKAIGRRSSIYVSPRFRYFPSSFTPESYNINQEYQFVGLHAGYIYSF